jgi:hypothetical protein
MSAYNFSWETTPLAWPARLGAWNPRSENYRTPVPCKHGSNCLFTGICSFVHPGEEGTGLKYFPGRSYLAEDGTECWESAVVRLIGSPSYYERRRLRLSWSAWCARVGLPLPQRPAPSGRRQQRLDLSPAPAPQMEEVEIVGEDSFVATAEHERWAARASTEEQLAAWTAYHQLYAQQMAYQQWLFQQRLQQQPQLTEAQLKAQLGDQLFPLIQQNLADTAAEREVIGWTGPLFTAGKFTGMLLEGCSVEELRQLVAGGAGSAELCELMLEACEVLAAAQKPQVTAEVRAAPPSATGLVGLAACADDTVRQLLEDVRRIDAGLPLRELPPSITSYEPLPGGKVRVVKSILPMPPAGEVAWADEADAAADARAAAERRVAEDRAAGWQKAGGDQLRRQAMKNARGVRR